MFGSMLLRIGWCVYKDSLLISLLQTRSFRQKRGLILEGNLLASPGTGILNHTHHKIIFHCFASSVLLTTKVNSDAYHDQCRCDCRRIPADRSTYSYITAADLCFCRFPSSIIDNIDLFSLFLLCQLMRNCILDASEKQLLQRA